MDLKTYTFEQLVDAYYKGYDRGKQHAEPDFRVESAPTVKPIEVASWLPQTDLFDKLNELIAAFNAHVAGEGSSGLGEWYYPKVGEVIRFGDYIKWHDEWEPARLAIGQTVGDLWKCGQVRRRR